MSSTINNTVAPSPNDEVPGSLAICAPLPPFRSVTGSVLEYVRTTSGTNHQGPYNFSLPPDALRYTQTSFMKLNGFIRLLAKDGSELPADAKVSPLNYFGQSWIRKIQIHCNNNLIYEDGSNYHLKVLANSYLNYDALTAQCRMRSSGYENEKKREDLEDDDDQGAAWDTISSSTACSEHQKRFAKSRWVEFTSDLFADIFRTSRDWPNNMNLVISIFPHPPEYYILSEEAYECKFEIKDLTIILKKIQPNASVVAANNVSILNEGAKFQFNGWHLAQAQLFTGQRKCETNSLFRGYVPAKTVYFFIDSEALTGSFKKNPANMKHWGLTEFVQKVNGIPSPCRPLIFDWENNNIAEAYSTVFDSAGISIMNRANLLTYDTFKQTRFMLVFDNTSDGASFFDNARNKTATGYVDVVATFKEALPCNVTLIGFGITDDTLIINGNRDIIVNPPELSAPK